MKVALVPDIPNWALHRICRGVQKSLKAYVDQVDIVFPDHPVNWPHYDTVFITCEYTMRPAAVNLKTQGVMGVFSHFSTHPELSPNAPNVVDASQKFRALVTPSDLLVRALQAKGLKPKRIYVGADPEDFWPRSRPAGQSSQMVVGWAGKDIGRPSQHAKNLDLLKAAIAKVNGIEFRPMIAHPMVNPATVDSMRDYYNGIDVYLCTSRHEGEPRPLFEAGLCGVCFIGTPVGNIPEVVTHGYSGLIVRPDVDEICQALEYARDHPTQRMRMAWNLHSTLEREWSWHSPRVRDSWLRALGC